MKKLIILLSLVLGFGCSGKKSKKSPSPDMQLDGEVPYIQEVKVKHIKKDPRENGEGIIIPASIGPLQKPKVVCTAGKPGWPEETESLPKVDSVVAKGSNSLKVLKKARVYAKPDAKSDLVGVIKQYSRLPLQGYKPAGNGCKKYWMNLGKDRWICGENLQGDKRSTLLLPQPILPKGRIVPHKYGRVRRANASYFANLKSMEENKPAGSFHRGDMVQLTTFKSKGGKGYWITGKNYLAWDDDISGYKVPPYHGIDLRKEDINLPAAIIRAKAKGAVIFEYPGGPEKKGVKPIPHYASRAIYDRKKVGKAVYYRIKEGWILARRVLSAWPADPPPGLKPCEKWIDINVSMQTLVAYEGREPVYVAPISTGKKKYPTKYGIFRIWAMKANSDMNSSMGASERYRVDDVPWAMFFYLGQAMHAAYWHTEFGNRKSHGCVNLTPVDAKWIYDWTDPHMPDGWLEIYVDEKSPVPGTLVVVRHKVDHEVPFVRYARKLAPPEDVKRLDEAKKKYLQGLTKKMYKEKN
ncbi:L,D-transpeptidase [Myxococcota bacterium]|nr:L,D-transpeptidase [Myxococcota bacterium]MBU1380035.1 L,D-transpeptidase [Myxococcota bacterium]MBU1496480.1 L,D-transpeptidase [Myxococcota bacterium]